MPRSYTNRAILPLGNIDAETGESPIFNVFETYGTDTTAELWREGYGTKAFLVFTSGDGPLMDESGTTDFYHDQTGSNIRRNCTLLGHARNDGDALTALLVEHGLTTKKGKPVKLSGYCYK